MIFLAHQFPHSLIHDHAGNFSPWLLQMLYRGLYAAQLEHWLRHFPAEQLLVVQSEEFYREPGLVMDRVTRFLSIDTIQWHSIVQPIYNFGNDSSVERGGPTDYTKHTALQPETKQRLQAFFQPYNDQLKTKFHDGMFAGWDYHRAANDRP